MKNKKVFGKCEKKTNSHNEKFEFIQMNHVKCYLKK